ncbi:hypothetical protein ABGB12_32020 [Actinocorallia sp. B10E7]|uniref:hypothetical protein n=1 Tax=Actinocorallia sp. B10E7 TaxID=3153558 RepID=UPI00325F280B
MRKLVIAGLTVVALAVPTGAVEAQAAQPSEAVGLKASPKVRKQLADRYYKSYAYQLACARRSKVVGPKRLYYGKIITRGKPTVYWAVGDIRLSCNPVSAQDGPHVWRKQGARGRWVYKGDTGGYLCGKVPRKMLRAWGLGCSPT